MDWVDKPQNDKDLYGILQLFRGSHLNNFPLKTLKLGWVAFHSVIFQLKCLDLQSNQYKKLVPVLSRFCNGLCSVLLSTLKRKKAFQNPPASDIRHSMDGTWLLVPALTQVREGQDFCRSRHVTHDNGEFSKVCAPSVK